MFSVIFEVLPDKANWGDYLDNATMLRPELEQVEGFVDNIRYKSLTRDGWIFSLSNWRDEKSLVRWRTRMRHHEVQQKGRDVIFLTTTFVWGKSRRITDCPKATPSLSSGLMRRKSGRGRRSR